jgi:hypothetical protein
VSINPLTEAAIHPTMMIDEKNFSNVGLILPLIKATTLERL